MLSIAFKCLCVPRHLLKRYKNIAVVNKLYSTDLSTHPDVVEHVSESKSTEQSQSTEKNGNSDFQKIAYYRFLYPEFLPDPRYEFRNKIVEKLERADMLKRRSVIDLPVFYVGSVLAVTASDPYSPGKENRFVGICICREHTGLRASFILRNIVDNQGIEVKYEMYSPMITKVEVLRLEKRLDDELFYLRDAPPEYSTFPFDMEPEFIEEDKPVRVNTMKVKLKDRPWNRKWWLKKLKGVEPFEDQLYPRDVRVREMLAEPWEKYDLMKEYRRCIPEEDQQEIWEEVDSHKKEFQLKKQQWKEKNLQKAPAKRKERV